MKKINATFIGGNEKSCPSEIRGKSKKTRGLFSI